MATRLGWKDPLADVHAPVGSLGRCPGGSVPGSPVTLRAHVRASLIRWHARRLSVSLWSVAAADCHLGIITSVNLCFWMGGTRER